MIVIHKEIYIVMHYLKCSQCYFRKVNNINSISTVIKILSIGKVHKNPLMNYKFYFKPF